MRPEYNRDGLMCFVDRSRGYLVQATPEEVVRQATLDWLIDELNIPAKLVRSEVHTARRRRAALGGRAAASSPGLERHRNRDEVRRSDQGGFSVRLRIRRGLSALPGPVRIQSIRMPCARHRPLAAS